MGERSHHLPLKAGWLEGAKEAAPVRVLVISHSAQPTGAPIALLRIMRWCVDHAVLEPFFVVRDDGELVENFQALGPTVQISTLTEARVEKVAASVLADGRARTVASFVPRTRLRRLCAEHKVRAIYVNTGTQGAFVTALRSTGLPIITHVHELERELRRTVGSDGIAAVVEQSHALIAVSSAVRLMLEAYGARNDHIVDIPEPIGEPTELSADERSMMRRSVFGVDDDTMLVLACGLPSWRKGTDVFLQVAKAVIADAPPGVKVAFRWLGGTLPNLAMTTLTDDIEHLGLEAHVAVIPHLEDADRLLGSADVLISTSREDPNPLVVLEAAAKGRPVICFENAGGAAELAGRGGAIAVPYLDVASMAAAVAALIDSPIEREALGGAASRLVGDANTIETVATAVSRVVTACVAH